MAGVPVLLRRRMVVWLRNTRRGPDQGSEFWRVLQWWRPKKKSAFARTSNCLLYTHRRWCLWSHLAAASLLTRWRCWQRSRQKKRKKQHPDCSISKATVPESKGRGTAGSRTHGMHLQLVSNAWERNHTTALPSASLCYGSLSTSSAGCLSWSQSLPLDLLTSFGNEDTLWSLVLQPRLMSLQQPSAKLKKTLEQPNWESFFLIPWKTIEKQCHTNV